MEDTVQILVAVGVLWLAYAWLFKGKPESTATTAGVDGGRPGPPVLGQGAFRHVSESMVESVTSAFPDVPRESVVYDLSRTRSAQATVEKLLTTGSLPAPPPGLFPPPPPPAAFSSSAATSSGRSTTALANKSLIDRFDLHARLPSAKGKERALDDDVDAQAATIGEEGSKPKGNAAKWESSAEAREASLKRRKEEMVLEARRKLLAKRARQEAERGATSTEAV